MKSMTEEGSRKERGELEEVILQLQHQQNVNFKGKWDTYIHTHACACTHLSNGEISKKEKINVPINRLSK